MSAPILPSIHAEIDSPRPLVAKADALKVVGWCFFEQDGHAPKVRLRTEAHVIESGEPLPRADVHTRFPQHAASETCGFVLEGQFSAGALVAFFEAQDASGNWHVFKSLCLVAEPRPFASVIESPDTSASVTERTHVSGWALHPIQAITDLQLRYGHQAIDCERGTERPDVPSLYPDSPYAASSGFITRTILSAGIGPARLKARLADGSAVIARTPLSIAIASDENHEPALFDAVERVALPGYTQHTPATPERTTTPLNLLFVLHGNFTANSTLQACALANELALAGHACVIAVPRDLETLQHQVAPRFHGCLHSEAIENGGAFPDGRGPHVIHAWTTRERIRHVATTIQQRHGGRLCVHLEDNEREILAQATGRPYSELSELSDPELVPLVTAELSHPRHSEEFIAAADGVTVIVDRLREFVPAGKPCATVWPAADTRYFFPRTRPDAFRRLLDVAPDTTVIFYHGNAHAANAGEMGELYAAVVALNESGTPVTLLRAGVDQVAFLPPDLAVRVRPFVLELGQILNHRHLPPLMALADLFVQPGEPDAFNDYRFPSKLPEFFAIGRPVIVPRSNLGEVLRHGEDAYVLNRADAEGIAEAIRALRTDHELSLRLAAGATAFAAKHLSWRKSATTLANFYATLARS